MLPCMLNRDKEAWCRCDRDSPGLRGGEVQLMAVLSQCRGWTVSSVWRDVKEHCWCLSCPRPEDESASLSCLCRLPFIVGSVLWRWGTKSSLWVLFYEDVVHGIGIPWAFFEITVILINTDSQCIFGIALYFVTDLEFWGHNVLFFLILHVFT